MLLQRVTTLLVGSRVEGGRDWGVVDGGRHFAFVRSFRAELLIEIEMRVRMIGQFVN